MGLICFDLEGPLAPRDNAYELMKLFSGGDKIFELISRYDDLVTLEGREDYEPGDTLSLIVPFLAGHNVTGEQISLMGQEAALTPGAGELISRLKEGGGQVFCASTSYEQYAMAVTGRVGIPGGNVACTAFPLDQIRRLLRRDEPALLKEAEKQIRDLDPSDDAMIKERLDYFYRYELPQKLPAAAREMAKVKPVGGRRKVSALERFAARTGKPLSHWAVVGDSITDFRMLQAVDGSGGLAIAFNANEYALPYSTMSLASTTLDDLWAVLETWDGENRERVEKLVREKEKAGGRGERGYFHWLAGTNDIASPLEVHRRIRRLVRKEAARLG